MAWKIAGKLTLAILVAALAGTLAAGAAAQDEGAAAWESLSPGELVWLARNMTGDEAAVQEARLALAEHVRTKYLANAEATRSVGIRFWKDLAACLGKHLPAEVLTAWRTGLSAAFLEDAEALSKLKLAQIGELTGTLGSLRDEGASGAVLTWFDGTTAWQSLEPEELGALASHLSRSGEPGQAARIRLAEHVTTTYLANAAAARSVSPAVWQTFARSLAEDLSAEVRAAWLAGIRLAYVDDAAALGALKAGEHKGLIGALGALGDKDIPKVTLAWFEKSTAWQSLRLKGLLGLAWSLSRTGEDGKAARTRLAEHVTATCLGDSKAVRALGTEGWKWMVRRLSYELSAESRERWAARLRSVFMENADAGLGTVQGLSLVLGLLGDEEAPDVVLTWFQRSPAWQSLKPGELASLAKSLSRCGEAGQAAKGQVAEHVRTKYLANAQAARSVKPGEWSALVGCLAKDLSAEARAAWLTGLRSAYAEDAEAFKSLKAAECRSLAGALRTLGDEHTADVVVAWLEQHEPSGMVTPGESVSLVAMAIHADVKTAGPLTAAFDETWLAADSREPLALRTISSIVSCWHSAGNSEKARAWVMRAYSSRLGTEVARESVSVAELRVLSTMLEVMGLTGKGKGYPAFAAALAAHARKGTLNVAWATGKGIPQKLAVPLGTPETQQVLENDLLDAQGAPRLDVAKILAWAYRNAGELSPWCDFLESRIAGTEDDTRAFWLAAKGYAMTLVPDPPNRLRRRRWLNDALAAAVSEQGRLVILQEFADFYSGISRPGLAAEMFESVKHQFGGEALAAIKTMQAQLRQKEDARQARNARVQSAVELGQKERRLKYYRKCLERARARGDSGTTARLQAKIQELEQD